MEYEITATFVGRNLVSEGNWELTNVVVELIHCDARFVVRAWGSGIGLSSGGGKRQGGLRGHSETDG